MHSFQVSIRLISDYIIEAFTYFINPHRYNSVYFCVIQHGQSEQIKFLIYEQTNIMQSRFSWNPSATHLSLNVQPQLVVCVRLKATPSKCDLHGKLQRSPLHSPSVVGFHLLFPLIKLINPLNPILHFWLHHTARAASRLKLVSNEKNQGLKG